MGYRKLQSGADPNIYLPQSSHILPAVKMRTLSNAFVIFVASTQLAKSIARNKRDTHVNIRRCDDDEPWRPLENINSTSFKEQEESSDLVIGSDSHEDYTAQVQDGRYQATPQVSERLKLAPSDNVLPVPSNHRIPLPVPLLIEVKEPLQWIIPVPMKVEKELLVPVEKTVYHPVVRPVPIKVVKEVRIPIPQPYPFYHPVYKLKLIIHSQDEGLLSTEDHDY